MGGGTPGGSDTEIQYNNSSAFGGIPGFTYNGTQLEVNGITFGTSSLLDDASDLFLFEPVISSDFSTGTRLTAIGNGQINFQGEGISAVRTNIGFVPNGSVANYPSILSFFSTDFIADGTNYSEMAFLSKGTADTYHAIVSLKGGSGTLHPMNIEATNSAGATPQLVIGIDGGVSIGTGNAAGSTNLNVAGVYKIDATQVVSNRVTGWTSPTGSALRTGYATSTATLDQVSQTLKALIDDLTTHGLIGT